MRILVLIYISTLIIISNESILNYIKCSSSQILNLKSLTCQTCATGKQPNTNQLIPNECVCKKGFYASDDGGCTEYFAGSSTKCSTGEFINSFQNNAAKKAAQTACTACDTNAYQNLNGTACSLCLRGMKYNSAIQKCQCINNAHVQTVQGCFPQSYTSILGLTLTSSSYSTRLKYLIPACYHFKSQLSCSQLVNLCVYSTLASTAECEFFKKANLTSYLYSETTNVYKVAVIDKSNQVKMKLISYHPQGNYVAQKDFRLSDIIKCGLPSNGDITLLIGTNLQITCQYNFNNLVGQISGQNYQSHLYQLLIQGQNSVYYEVNTYLNQNSQPIKRFFLEDAFTSSSTLNVLTNFKLQFTLNTDGQLITPSIYLAYTKLSLEQGTGITPSSLQKQSLSYSVQFSSELTGFWSVILPIFIVVNILITIHAAAKTYVGYLNRKTPFLFFLNFIDIWSLWIFYFLLITSGYWFIFTKTTSTIYTFISNESSLYFAFYILFALMVTFRIVSMIIQKAEKLKIQIFMINWEKQNLGNSWRQIFIINSLAEFCTYRTFSVFWILLVMLFFVTGLKWQQHSRQVINTSLDQIQYFHRKNSILLYFLSTSILLVISIIFKILRRLTVLFWPYPFEDFVDYCSITNISFFFMKKRSPQAYYIHAQMPDKAEVTFKQINQAIKRGLRKNRSLSNEVNTQKLKLFLVYVNRELEQKFAQLLKKQEDQDHHRHIKYAIGSSASIKPTSQNEKDTFKPRKQFIQRKLKPALQEIVQQKSKNFKSLIESFFRLPPLDLRNEKGLNSNSVFQDDKFDLVRQVFPNGDEFQQLHTIITIYLLWVIVTGSSPIAAFLTYFCDEFIMNAWIGSSYRKHLQKMTRVKQGFMM